MKERENNQLERFLKELVFEWDIKRQTGFQQAVRGTLCIH